MELGGPLLAGLAGALAFPIGGLDPGEAGLEPRSWRPLTSPTKVRDLYEDEIVTMRKDLLDQGFDAGARPLRSTWRASRQGLRMALTRD